MRKAKKTKAANQLGDAIQLRGYLEYQLRNALTGEIVQQGRQENIVVTKGRVWMLNRLCSNNTNTVDRIYLGKDTQSPATGLTALSVSFSSKAGTMSSAQYTSNPPSYELQCSWASNETHDSSSAIQEFGLYVSEGTMVGYLTTSAAINFGSTNTLAISYRLSN